jgi:hypothetical protein
MMARRSILARGVAVAFAAFLGTAGWAPSTPAATPAAKGGASSRSGPAPKVEMVREPRALDILKASSDRLAAARSMSFTAVVTYEYPSQLGPPIAYTTTADVLMQRPDRLRVITLGDGPASEFYYDGRQMIAFAPAENLAAVAAAPPTIDGMLKAAFDTAAIYFPFTDLIVANPYAAVEDGLKLACFIGQSKVVGGTITNMVAYANDDLFVQVWIGAEDKLPRRVRAVYRQDPLRLRHQLDLSNWQLDVAVPADAFASAKAASASRIGFASPELPKPVGAKAPARMKGAPAAKSQ